MSNKGKRYTTREIAYMHKIYRQTMSMTATAKACGCALSTVRKYRDEQQWVTPQQIKELASKGGNDVTLTPEIAIKLAAGWRVKIEDVYLCPIVGITYNQLERWLRDDREVTLIVNVVKADGTEAKRMETIGLRQLRAREWNTLRFNLMNSQLELAKEAKRLGDPATASRIEQWVLEKVEPKFYGRQGETNLNVNVQTNVINVDDLDLPLETRKQILCKIREKKQIEGEQNGKVP